MSFRRLTFLSLCAGALALALFEGDAKAQDLTTADTGHFTGADRTARLVAGAQDEGNTLTIYSSSPINQMNAIIEGFNAATGIEVNFWRAESESIIRRAIAEARTGRYEVDIIETNAPSMEAMDREGLLQEVDLPVFAELMDGAVAPGRAWVISRVLIYVTAINTNLVRGDDIPQTFEDLQAPKWRGRSGFEAENSIWLMTLADRQGEDETTSFFRRMVANNNVSIRRGHSLLVNLIAAGEVPLGVNVFHDFALQVKDQGAPIEVLYLPPLVAHLTAAAVLRNTPRPHAAVLFLDYLLSEDGQRIVQEQRSIATNMNVQQFPENFEPIIPDISRYVDQNEKWIDLYTDIFSGRAP